MKNEEISKKNYQFVILIKREKKTNFSIKKSIRGIDTAKTTKNNKKLCFFSLFFQENWFRIDPLFHDMMSTNHEKLIDFENQYQNVKKMKNRKR